MRTCRSLALISALCRCGLTQRELARRAGLSECTVSILMHGLRPPLPRTAAKIAAALGVTPGELWPQFTKKKLCRHLRLIDRAGAGALVHVGKADND